MENTENQEEKHKKSLDELFRKPEKVEDAELAEVLIGKVYFVEGNNSVFVENEYLKKSIEAKLIAAGLALYVLLKKGIISDEDVARQTEWYANVTQSPPKSVLETLSRLKGKKRLFERTDRGYKIPAWAIRKALAVLK